MNLTARTMKKKSFMITKLILLNINLLKKELVCDDDIIDDSFTLELTYYQQKSIVSLDSMPNSYLNYQSNIK